MKKLVIFESCEVARFIDIELDDIIIIDDIIIEGKPYKLRNTQGRVFIVPDGMNLDAKDIGHATESNINNKELIEYIVTSSEEVLREYRDQYVRMLVNALHNAMA